MEEVVEVQRFRGVLVIKAHILLYHSILGLRVIKKKKEEAWGVRRRCGRGRSGGGTEAGSYSRLIDSCITQLKAQGPSRTCNESKEDEEEEGWGVRRRSGRGRSGGGS